MSEASRFLRNVSGAWEKDPGRRGLGHWCPGCEEMHIYWIEGDHKYGPVWSFNGRVEAPSFSPSMKITYDGKDIESDDAVHECCHYFVKLGEEFGEPLKLERGRSYIQYCGDTTHALKGQTLPLPELPEHLRG